MQSASLVIPGAWLLFLAASGCEVAPRTDGFTDLAIAGSRQAISPAGGAARVVTWPSVNLTMVENGPVLVTLDHLKLTLEPNPAGAGTKATLTGTVRPQGYCTSPTWSGGVGQVLQIFFEKADNSLVFPWTAGALQVSSGAVPQALSFQLMLTGMALDLPVQAELVVQAALWVNCP
ncbi:MAG TPA: hypothetical protein VMU54_22665 [Planctomycetota bacterium]|nr:hypothetical protein [Planctomycetota bacterium]